MTRFVAFERMYVSRDPCNNRMSGGVSFVGFLLGGDYDQSLFPSLVHRASEKKSARKINRRLMKTGSKRRAEEASSFRVVPI